MNPDESIEGRNIGALDDAGNAVAVPLEMSKPDAGYFLDHYGVCSLTERGVRGGCVCLNAVWMGRGCPWWIPLGVKSFDELAKVLLVEPKRDEK